MSSPGPVRQQDVPVRDASTVVLLRDGGSGVQTWLLTRVSQMTFAAGMSVFPGGRVEHADADVPIQGGDPSTLAARFGCPERTARALIGGAARETFEETGVLLAVPSADLSHARADVEQGRVPFADLLRSHGVAVDAAALVPWSRWVTPAGEVRRYDTRFFVGTMPPGVDAADVTSESSSAQWVTPGEALEQAQRGERRLLPPTAVTLTSLLPYASVAEAVAASAARDLAPVRPNLLVRDDGSVEIELPDGRVFTIR